MNLLSDEILNKYLDGELTPTEKAEVEELLKESESDRKRFNALKLIHENLSAMEIDEVSPGFNEKVMLTLEKKYARTKQQNYFIAAVTFFFGFICIGIVAYLLSGIISSSGGSESTKLIDIIKQTGEVIITFSQKLFTGEGLSIIGSVFSFVIIIAGHIFYEQQKRMKTNLGR